MSVFCDMSKQTILYGSEQFPRHSEASILELKDGNLLIAWQCHEKSQHGAGDEAPSTVSLMNSYDNGKTWCNRRVVAKMIPGCVNVYSPSLFRRSDGSIALYFKRYTHLVPQEPIYADYYRIISTDEGETWSEEEILWKDKKYYTINDAVKRLASGAVVIPVEESTGGWCAPDDHNIVSVLRSEDDFQTWTKSNEITVPMRGLEEPCIAQRPDGTLYMVMRNQLGSVFYSESHDDGRSWSKPQTTGLHAPESCPCIATIPNTDAQIVVWNNAEYDMTWYSHYGKRTPLTMAISRDGLKTFTHFTDIETDPNWAFTNPALTFTSSGLALLTYWASPYHPNGRMCAGPIDLKLATFRVDL